MRLNQTRIAHGQRLDGLAAQTTRDHVRPVRSIIVLNRGVGALLNISRSVHVAFGAKRTCMDATPRPPQSWMTPTDLGQIKIPQRSTFRPFIGPDRLSGSRKADLFRRRDLFEGRCQCRVRPRYFARCLPAPEQAARVSVPSLSASARSSFSRRKCSSRDSGDRHIPAQRWCCRAIARYWSALTMVSSHARPFARPKPGRTAWDTQRGPN
jgi:hypothetical protein